MNVYPKTLKCVEKFNDSIYNRLSHKVEISMLNDFSKVTEYSS